MNTPSVPNLPPELAALLERERKHQLGKMRVLGYPVWGLERFGSYERALAGKDGTLRKQSDATRKQRIQGSLTDLLSAAPLRGRDIWVLSSTQYRRRDEHGVARCLFTGELERQLGERLLFLERNRGALPAHTDPAVVTLDALLEVAAGGAAQLTGPLSRTVPSEQVEAFGLDARRLTKAALVGHAFEALATSMVRLLRPTAAFVLCGYTRFVPFQRVLKRAGVPLIEMQHGIVHRFHPGYAVDPLAEGDYLPDHMLVFGERFGQVLEQCSPYWRGRWSVGGHPWLAERARQADAEQAARGPVVVFSQPLAPISQQLRAFLPEFRRLLPRDIEIVLKPHPREVDAAQDYAAALAEGVKLAPPSADSYQLLAQCRTSVCVFSTLALEALAFPCPSVVLRSELWPAEIRHFVDSGALLAADSPAELCRIVQQPPPPAERSAVARELFGLGQPPLDFAGLIRRLRATTAR